MAYTKVFEHTTWLVRESIADNVEKGNNVYVGLLDIKKAFDSVWHEGLFHKLFKYGIRGKTWRILRYLFHDFKCMVRYGHKNSKQFSALQGIHQGSPTSMFLFQMYVNELLCEINSNLASVKCVGIRTGGIAFADDIALMSNSVEGLQTLVRIAYEYSKKWRFQFNPSKCSIVQFGEEKRNIRINLGAERIETVKSDFHLGVVLTNKDECVEEAIREKIQQCKNIGYAVQSLGSSTTPVTPKTSSKVHWAVCVPKLCYGTELLDINEPVMNNMESFHCGIAKHVQNLPTQCSNPGSLATLGWKNIRAHCSFLKFIFLWQLLTLPFQCIYKTVCVRRLCLIFYTGKSRRGPLWNIIEICKEYGICEIVRSALESGEYMSKMLWKRMIKDTIGKLETKRWSIKCKMYKTLYFMSSYKFKMSVWWIHAYHDHSFARQNRIIVKLLLNVFMYLEKDCPCCNNYVANSVTHILFDCICNVDQRVSLWNDVKVNSPAGLILDMERMSMVDRTRFILNACNVSYVKEWKHMYDALSNYIFQMCKVHNEALNSC